MDRSMESHVKIVGAAVAVTLYVVFAVSPGLAQEDGPKAGSDRDAPRANSVGTGDGAAVKGGANAKGNDLGGDRGVGQNHPGDGDPCWRRIGCRREPNGHDCTCRYNRHDAEQPGRHVER